MLDNFSRFGTHLNAKSVFQQPPQHGVPIKFGGCTWIWDSTKNYFVVSDVPSDTMKQQDLTMMAASTHDLSERDNLQRALDLEAQTQQVHFRWETDIQTTYDLGKEVVPTDNARSNVKSVLFATVGWNGDC